MKNMDWKLLKSEYLFRRPWLTARRDVCQLPDGRIMNEYYVLEYPTFINVVAVTTDGERGTPISGASNPCFSYFVYLFIDGIHWVSCPCAS